MDASGDFVRPVLHHVTLKTSRVAEMVDWYGKLVGCHPNFTGPEGSWTTNDAANHRVAFLAIPPGTDDPQKLRHAGMHHMAFEFPSMQALIDNYFRLEPLGVLPHICLDHGLTMSFYYVDPDGNSVELQSDNFGNWDQSSEYMRSSPDFKANPIGVEVDPPKLAKALAAGLGVREVLERSRKGEYLPATPGDVRIQA